jgi:hypothetical protein
LTYQIFFDSQTDVAIVELDQDIRRSVRAALRTVASPPPDTFLKSNDSFLSAWDSVEQVSVLTNIHLFSRTDMLILKIDPSYPIFYANRGRLFRQPI